jgi:tripartite-type tricarboxylate transporter receptor subunit TctC
MMRGITLVAAALLTLTGSVAHASDQDFPNKPVTFVSPFPPGGVADTNTRVLAKALSEQLRQPVIVDNRPGAGGVVGTEYVANAKPDGYTILYGSSATIGTNVSLYKKLSFDPVKSFAPIHSVVESPLIVVTNADRPYKTFAELIEFAKKNPGKVNFGSAGSGTATHLAGILWQSVAKVKMTHIPYKGSGPEMADLIGGVLDVSTDFSVIVSPQVEAGKLNALAVTTAARLANKPDIPTLAELGYPEATITSWSAIVAPAGTPQEVVDILAKAISNALKSPEVVDYFERNGSSVMKPMTGDALRDFFISEIAKIKRVVEMSGATAG